MNTDTQLPGQQLLVTLNVFDAAIIKLMLPENNFIGALILGLLLDSKLETAGQLLRPVSFGGQLNHACAICSVRDAHESARILRETLEQAHLALIARIYRLDEDELIFRNLFPSPGQDIRFEDCSRLLEAHAALAAPAIARLNEFARLHQSKPEAPESPANPS